MSAAGPDLFDAPDAAGTPPPPATAEEKLARLRLARAAGVGPAQFLALLARFGAAEAALEALPSLPAGGRRRAAPISRAAAEDELAAGAALGARLLHLGAPDYPARLAAIADPPPVLWVLGPADPGAGRAVAVIGARNASAHGLRFAEAMGRGLAEAGAAVISGLARGVDGAAHRGALSARGAAPPPTVAALAGGVDHVYPSENAGLHEEIRARGALVSEMPIGLHPAARHFPRRNRVISGLSEAVVIVEGAERSGSMITARAALEQGRDVMAAPGHPYDPRAAAPNALIRDGALLIRSPADVVEGLGPERRAPAAAAARTARAAPAPAPGERAPPGEAAPASAAEPLAARIRAQLSAAPIGANQLARALGAPAAEVAAAISELEIAGELIRHPGGAVGAPPPERR